MKKKKICKNWSFSIFCAILSKVLMNGCFGFSSLVELKFICSWNITIKGIPHLFQDQEV